MTAVIVPQPIALDAPNTPAYFDALFGRDDDPWKFRSRWYEARKRALTLAALPSARYASAFEPGCAIGELSAALAPRCERLLVSDGSARAVEASRLRLVGFSNAEVRQLWVPAEWPEEKFDLIVVSELGYFLATDDLDALAARMLASLADTGVVLACHWRRPIEGCALDGDAVHRRLGARLALAPVSQLIEPDFRIDVWSLDARSVAQREGFA